MADKKKEGGEGIPPMGWLFILIALALVILFRSLPGFVVSVISGAAGTAGGVGDTLPQVDNPAQPSSLIEFFAGSSAYDTVAHWWSIFVPISVFISLILASGVLYCVFRIYQIRREEAEALEKAAKPLSSGDAGKTQLRWQKIIDEVSSDDHQMWRTAIIDADIMLDELLDVQGYKGETMGDKMKQVERSDWNTIDLAWEAHKVRNRIAHDGTAFEINQREARRVISLYEEVFKEFHYFG